MGQARRRNGKLMKNMKNWKRSNRVLIVGSILTLLLGIGGGWAGEWLNAPFYFGFFTTFTLAGLITMFWLAAVISDTPGQ